MFFFLLHFALERMVDNINATREWNKNQKKEQNLADVLQIEIICLSFMQTFVHKKLQTKHFLRRSNYFMCVCLFVWRNARICEICSKIPHGWMASQKHNKIPRGYFVYCKRLKVNTERLLTELYGYACACMPRSFDLIRLCVVENR